MHPVAAGFVLHIEGLRHIGAVQPDLPRVDFLVPEVAFLGAGLGFQLAAHRFNGIAVALLARQIVQGKQVFALIDVVKVVLLHVVGVDHAAVLDEIIQKILAEGQKFLVPGGFVQAQAGGDHTAVNVVPLVGLAAAHLFNVPKRGFGGAAGNQIVHILSQRGQNFFVGHGVNPPQSFLHGSAEGARPHSPRFLHCAARPCARFPPRRPACSWHRRRTSWQPDRGGHSWQSQW